MFENVGRDQAVAMTAAGGHKIRALLLDDSDFDRRRIKRLSQKTDLPLIMDEVSSIAELENAVQMSRYDLVMIDYRLPVGNGMQALDRLERDPQNKHSGKIMITGAGETRTAVKAMQGGCHDFIEKEDLSVQLLRNSITHAIQAAQQQLHGQMTVSHQEALVRKGFLSALDDQQIRSHVDSVIAEQLQVGEKLNQQGSPMSDDMILFLNEIMEEDEFLFLPDKLKPKH